MGIYEIRYGDFIMAGKNFNTPKYEIRLSPATMVDCLELTFIGGIYYTQAIMVWT